MYRTISSLTVGCAGSEARNQHSPTRPVRVASITMMLKMLSAADGSVHFDRTILKRYGCYHCVGIILYMPSSGLCNNPLVLVCSSRYERTATDSQVIHNVGDYGRQCEWLEQRDTYPNLFRGNKVYAYRIAFTLETRQLSALRFSAKSNTSHAFERPQ